MLLVHEPDAQNLSMILYDQQAFVANDKIIGHLNIPVKEMNQGETVDKWMPLQRTGSFEFGNPVNMGVQVKMIFLTPALLSRLCMEALTIILYLTVLLLSMTGYFYEMQRQEVDFLFLWTHTSVWYITAFTLARWLECWKKRSINLPAQE